MDQQLTPCEEKLVISRARKVLTIGIAAEAPDEETRVPITPQGVEVLTAQGHKIIVEHDAGAPSRFADDKYADAGAEISKSHAQIFNADIILKLSPPTEEEAELMHDGQTLVCFISRHQRNKEIFQSLCKKKVTIIATDFITDSEREDPVVFRCLGEIEGMLAITTAAHLLETTDGGKGIIIGGVTGVPPTEIVIIGSDMAATSAARTAISLGCTVKIFDTDHARLQTLATKMPHHIFTSILHPQALKKALRSADVIIATRQHPAVRGYCIPSEYLSYLKRGAVVIDLDSTNGGRTENTKPTTMASPSYNMQGLIHHCLPDITTLVPHTASIVISDILTPIISKIADAGGIDQAARFHRNIQDAIAMFQGTTTNKYLAKKTNTEYFDVKLLII